MATTRFEHDGIMTKQEQENMVDFILYLYEAYKKWCHHPVRKDKDRHIDHILYIAVRDITRIIGENKNLYISEAANKFIKADKTTTYRALLNSIRANGKIIKEHYKPANDFYKQFEDCCVNNKPFGEKEAKAWLKDAVIAFITKDEDKKLTELGYVKNRPRPAKAYKEAGIIKTHFTPAKKGQQ